MTIKIDKNIRIPQKNTKTGWPLSVMEYGDSFVIEGVQQLNSVRSAAAAMKKHDKKFNYTTRQESSGNGGKLRWRLWRIKPTI